jgi:hypothetical protein
VLKRYHQHLHFKKFLQQQPTTSMEPYPILLSYSNLSKPSLLVPSERDSEIIVASRMTNRNCIYHHNEDFTTEMNSYGNIEEKVLRRRMQYRIHQRRHRAKQKMRTEILQKEVNTLRAEIDNMMNYVMESRNIFAMKTASDGAPIRTIHQYFDIFRNGYSKVRYHAQEDFLRSIMKEDLEGLDFSGRDYLINQWRMYDQLFKSMEFDLKNLDVAKAAEFVIVKAETTLNLRAHRAAIEILYPHLRGQESLIQTLLSCVIGVPTKISFVFEEEGSIAKFLCECDFVTALQSVFGSLTKATAVITGANMSVETGRLWEDHVEKLTSSSVREKESTISRSDPRLEVDFLLS